MVSVCGRDGCHCLRGAGISTGSRPADQAGLSLISDFPSRRRSSPAAGGPPAARFDLKCHYYSLFPCISVPIRPLRVWQAGAWTDVKGRIGVSLNICLIRGLRRVLDCWWLLLCVVIADDRYAAAAAFPQHKKHDTLSYSSFAMGDCVRRAGWGRLVCAFGPDSTDCRKPSNTPSVQSSRSRMENRQVSWPPGIRVLLPMDTGPTAASPWRPPDHVTLVSYAISTRHSRHDTGVGAAGGSAPHVVHTRRGGKRVHYPCSGSLSLPAKLQSAP